jgi:RNA polymerase sigma-70 factor, ECF subfamily
MRSGAAKFEVVEPPRHDGCCGNQGREQHVKTPDDQERDKHYHEFVRLLMENERRLTAYVHALIPLWQDAEDVLQNTKLRLWEQFDSFRPGADFAAWAIAIARYMVLAHRTVCRRERVCFSDDLLEKLSKKVMSSNRDDRLPALLGCVKMLDVASRRLLCLACSGHQRIKDIAHDLSQKPSATRMALLRIRRTLSECVRKRLQEERER